MSRPCIFCQIAAGRAPASTVLSDGDLVAFMDIYPMRHGHVLVAPREHATRLGELDPALAGRLFQVAGRIGDALRQSELVCDDVNIVLNDGPAANQTVPHVHVHVVPRRRRDLPRLFRMLLQRPVQPLLGGPPRAELDRHAAAIARYL